MTLKAAQADFMAMLWAAEAPAFGEGLRVYHHAYRARLLGALSETYERVWTWLGDDAFREAARAYIEGHPSQSWTLDAYGLYFPDFLEARFPGDPEIAELGWLDGALRQAFAAPDAAPFDAEAFASITDWSLVRLEFNPALRHRPLRTNAPALWRSLSRNEAPADIVSLDETHGTLTGLCVWKTALEPRFRTLAADEYSFLRALHDGQTFAEACEDMARDSGHDDPTQTVGGWLSQWIGEGLLSGARAPAAVTGEDLLTGAAIAPLCSA